MTVSLDDVRAMDIDSHEMAPLDRWGSTWGPHFGRFAEMLAPSLGRFGDSPNNFDRPGLQDELPIDDETVWNERGPSAPSAFDFDRRVEVMDLMATARQLVFPSAAMTAFGCLLGGELRQAFMAHLPYDEYASTLQGAVDEYNAWVAKETAKHGDRLRFAGFLHAESPAELIRRAETMLESGIKVFHLPVGVGPGGTSPANHDLNPFWQLASENNIPVVSHLGGQAGYRASDVWTKAPEFAPGKVESTEVGYNPLSVSTVHQAATNFISAMVLGGVFERFPSLRFGAIEFGAYWVGPLAETLDLWATRVFRKRVSAYLSMKPSEYLNRNVRACPFYFEDLTSYFERFTEVADCYAYGSDYPHIEGGKSQLQGFYDQVAPLGDDVVRKFFVGNGELLLPELG
ncbi:amidohydrolase family protein [Amycolatopsis pithecellobii]|uniref:Amidohydrolase family protein n=1 Tax=Amycolatopsis pithecellobii TaxID=664692 RepID=A0A6N7Z5A3_9PSEU|nr:amidohydrolase family protein [Amycolatopsis pithecellobii]MTD55660.1 amidohydrolase family protein [Amycolatopsis pithecellobii]